MVVKQSGQGLGIEQRHVRGRDEHGAVGLAFGCELVHRALDCTTGARQIVLVDDFDGFVVGACRLGDAIGLVMDDNGKGFRIKTCDGRHDPLKEGLARERVQHLRRGGTHPGAFPCGKNDCG